MFRLMKKTGAEIGEAAGTLSHVGQCAGGIEVQVADMVEMKVEKTGFSWLDSD